MKMILKAENIFEHKNQSDTVKAIKAIKAMRSTIQLKQYDQSNIVSDTIRTNLGVVTLSVALTQRPETRAKPDVQEVDVER